MHPRHSLIHHPQFQLHGHLGAHLFARRVFTRRGIVELAAC
jgi:hypothetical protein